MPRPVGDKAAHWEGPVASTKVKNNSLRPSGTGGCQLENRAAPIRKPIKITIKIYSAVLGRAIKVATLIEHQAITWLYSIRRPREDMKHRFRPAGF